MSYLSQPASTLDYGVVKIGNNIQVLDGVVSLAQSVAPNANVTFNTLDVSGDIRSNGEIAITEVLPAAGDGISLTDVVALGNTASFTIENTGVLSLTSGPGIYLSAASGNITVSAYGADVINVYGAVASYTATNDDEYIGVNSTTAVTISLPIGTDGRVYTIKDERGQGSGKITIKPVTGELVDGSASYVIGVPYQSVNIVFRAGQWRMI